MRAATLRSAFATSVLVALGACSLPGEDSEKATPTSTTTAPAADPLESLGTFEGRFDPVTGELSITPVGEPPSKPSLQREADGLTPIAGSASGIPAGGGVVVYSPTFPTSVGCPSGGNRCGTIRVVNRTGADGVLRNVYAVVSTLTTGWTIANTDTSRSFSGIPSSVGLFYYEHLLASDRPNSSATPSSGGKVGFRGDRTWSFKKGTGATSDEFFFRFDVYAKKVTCTPSTSEESPSDPGYNSTEDRDCDGVPGVSRNRALFVDPVLGADSTTVTDPTDYRGSLISPFRSVSFAVTQASATRNTIVIGGTFPTSATALDFSGSASQNVRHLLGQYDTTNGFANRTLSPTPLAFTSTYGIFRSGATNSLLLEGLNITTTTSSGPAYAIFNSGTSAATLTLRDVTLSATATGNGASGAHGTRGSNGVGGAKGAVRGGGLGGAGGAGCYGGTTAGAGGRGGDGGSGYLGGGGNGSPGQMASTGGTGGGGGARGGGFCGSDGSAGGWGSNGGDGTAGGPATAMSAAPASYFISTGYNTAAQAGGNGTAGNNGSGGGGGGGETGSCGLWGNDGGGGGGGGGGGCGGHPGLGGGAGNGAFGVFSYASSGAASVTYAGSVSITVKGSNGGAGGNGADGGSGGGSGAPGPDSGGWGGNGGMGGRSGAGAGGNGGPAICAVLKGAAPSGTATCNKTAGNAGANGIGPIIPGASPSGGYAADYLPF